MVQRVVERWNGDREGVFLGRGKIKWEVIPPGCGGNSNPHSQPGQPYMISLAQIYAREIADAYMISLIGVAGA